MKHSNIIIDLIEGKDSLVNILLRLKTLLSDLNDDRIKKWIDCEINGYNDKDEIPSFRQITGTPQCDVLNANFSIPNYHIPLDFSDENIIKIVTVPCKKSVLALENIAKENSKDFMYLPGSATYQYLKKYVNGEILNLKFILSGHEFMNIFSTIKNKILDILLALENKFGILDSYDVKFTDTESKETRNLIVNIIFDSSISIGDNNKIKDTSIISGSRANEEF